MASESVLNTIRKKGPEIVYSPKREVRACALAINCPPCTHQMQKTHWTTGPIFNQRQDVLRKIKDSVSRHSTADTRDTPTRKWCIPLHAVVIWSFITIIFFVLGRESVWLKSPTGMGAIPDAHELIRKARWLWLLNVWPQYGRKANKDYVKISFVQTNITRKF